MAEMHYDFESALRALIDAQSDVMMLVTKWAEMIAPDARDVSFLLKGEGGEPAKYTIPNIQKVIDTINTRTLPQNPSFKSVHAVAQNGGGVFTAGGIEFDGAGKQATYSADGIQGKVQELADGATTWTEWPIPRYAYAKSGTSPVLTLSPDLPDRGVAHMSDFYIAVEGGVTVELRFSSYGSAQRAYLTGDGNTIFHICMFAENVPNAGRRTWGRIEKMSEA